MTPTAADQKNWSELLDGLPDDLRYTPLNGEKCPIDPDTGYPRKKWETFHYLPSDLDQMNGVVKAVGLHLGPTSNGVMAIDFDGVGSEIVFQNLTGRRITELPPTIRWSSGRDGHYQCLFRVPEECWSGLSTKDFPPKHGTDDPHFELRWNGQSVIAGEHPEKLLGDGYYSFADWHSPKDVEIADAPYWLLKFFHQKCAGSQLKEPRRGFISEQNAVALARAELLYDISRTREIVSEWLHPADDHNSYDTWTMVGMVCAYLSAAIGEPLLLFDLWNEWSSEQSNYDGEEKLAKKWESFDRDGPKAYKFGTLHEYATENTDWKPSQTQEEFVETLPEPEKKAAKSQKKAKHEVIADLMAQLYELEKTGTDWNRKAALRSDLMSGCHVDKKELDGRLFDMTADEFGIQIHDGGTDKRTNKSLIDAYEGAELEQLVPGFLHRGCDAVIFGSKGSGKSFMAAGLSYHACCGGKPFDRDEPVSPALLGRTLWIGSDGGDGAEAMLRAYVRMIKAPDEGLWRSRICFWGANSKEGEPPWAFTVRNLFLLFEELEAGQKSELPYNLVVIDTLKSVMSLGKVDYSIGAMDTAMRLIQGAAAQFNVSIVWLHHTKQGKEHAGGNSNIVEVPYSVIALHKKESKTHKHLVRCVVEKLRGEPGRVFNYTLDTEDGLFKVVEGDDIEVNPMLKLLWLQRDLGASMHDLWMTQRHLAHGTVSNKCTRLVQEGLCFKKQKRWWPTEKLAKQLAIDMPEIAGEVNQWLADTPPMGEAA